MVSVKTKELLKKSSVFKGFFENLNPMKPVNNCYKIHLAHLEGFDENNTFYQNL